MHLTRSGWAVTAVAAAVAVVTGTSAGPALDQLRGDDFPAALLAAGQLVGLAVSTWVLLVVAAASLRCSLPGVPHALKALLFAGVAVSIAAAPAHAERSHDLTGLPLPDRPVASATAAPVIERSAVTAATVTVRSGDTLWAIAADTLPGDASSQQIAAACAAWYLANRDVIGADPDLVLPGQVLTSPAHLAEDDS